MPGHKRVGLYITEMPPPAPASDGGRLISPSVSYIAGEARQEMLDTLGDAIDEIAAALCGSRRGVRSSSARFPPTGSRRSCSARSRPRTGVRSRPTPASPSGRGCPAGRSLPRLQGLPSTGIRGFVDSAVESVAEADAELAELQDSMMPVEVGDPELRAGLAAGS